MTRECPRKGCDGALVLRTGQFGKFYSCSNYQCDIRQRADRKGNPVGKPTTGDVRKARIAAHGVFDLLWTMDGGNRQTARRRAYSWLAQQLQIDETKCHIGMMETEMCQRVIELCRRELLRRLYPDLRPALAGIQKATREGGLRGVEWVLSLFDEKEVQDLDWLSKSSRATFKKHRSAIQEVMNNE